MNSGRDVILKKLLYNLQENNQSELEERFDLGWYKNTGFFEIAKIIGSNNIVIFLLVLAAVFGFFYNRNVHLGIVFGFLVCVIMTVVYMTYWREDTKDYFVEQQHKLRFLNTMLSDTTVPATSGNLLASNTFMQLDQQESYLYTNPAVVDFYYDYREYSEFAMAAYANSLRACNALLRLELDMRQSVNNRQNQYEMAEMLQKECMNQFQSAIYKLPSADATNFKYNDGLSLLLKITNRIMDNITEYVKILNRRNGINMEYYPVLGSQFPKANDVGTYGYSSHFDLFT